MQPDFPSSNTPSDAPPRVCAVVVAFNRAARLRECLNALQLQTRSIDEILVVNNASTDDTARVLAEEFPGVTTLHLSENGGGAGGFHAGMKHAYDAGFEWLWLMDDDVCAAPDALEQMMEARAGHSVLVPLQRDTLGRFYGVALWRGRHIEIADSILAGERPRVGRYLWSFAGSLVSRRVIEAVGLPYREFFIWFDDAEYSLRVHRTRLTIAVVPEALVAHDVGGTPKQVRFAGRTLTRTNAPPWKLYYGARNTLWTLLRHPTPKSQQPVHLWFYALSQGYQAAQDLWCEADRGQRIKMRWLGMRDGVLGKLGKRDFPV